MLQPPSVADAKAEALRAMAARDLPTAKALLRTALAGPEAGPSLWLNLAACQRGLGELQEALASVEAALGLEPRNFMALLMKASLLERLGQARKAATAYGVALTQAPPDDRLDPATLQAVRHARAVNRRHVLELDEVLVAGTAESLRACTPAEVQRVRTFADLLLGLRRHYPQQPTDFLYPGLPAIEFYPRDHFPWLEALEAETPAILAELQAVMAGGAEGFSPYIRRPENVPVDQWAELNNSPRWSAFHLIENGARREANCARCPRTVAAAAHLPQPELPGRSPALMFSHLKPRTRIPPHTGVANFRLVVHVPLIVPPGCGFRVGGETREWKPGEAWVFDDTIQHEAWNDSDQSRVILIADIWSPFLSGAERAAIGAALAVIDDFNEAPPGGLGA